MGAGKRPGGSGYSLSQQWRRKLQGEAVAVGDFDFEIALLHLGLSALPLDRVPWLHPRARAELEAYLTGRYEAEKAEREKARR